MILMFVTFDLYSHKFHLFQKNFAVSIWGMQFCYVCICILYLKLCLDVQINKVEPLMDDRKQRLSGKPISDQILRYHR
jgi:hypothetical protein